MIINYFHLFFYLAVFLLFIILKGRKGALFLVIVSLPMYTISLVELSFSGFYLKIPELYLLMYFLIYFKDFFTIKKKSLLFSLLFFSPFLVSIIYNLFFFEPIKVWEINPENRVVWWDKEGFRSGLTFTNVTQLMYVVLCLLVFLLASMSNKIMDKSELIFSIKSAAFVVSLIGVFQVLSFNLEYYSYYIDGFYNYGASEYNRLAYNVIQGIKRINSTMTEPSVFGFYMICTFFVLFLMEGFLTLKSFVFIFCFSVALFSISGTFYFGIAVLLFFWVMVRFGSFKWLFLIIGCIVIFLLGFYIDEIVEYFSLEGIFSQKKASFSERFEFGVSLPLENISKSPFFGYAFGTDRPTVLLFNLVVSLGVLGFVSVFSAFVFFSSYRMRLMAGMVLVLGLLIPDITFYFIWFYLGFLFSMDENEAYEK